LLTLVICALFLCSNSNSKNNKKIKERRPTFNSGDVIRDYYQQNTVNDLIKNDRVRSEIEYNPSRYIVLNGKSKEKDPQMMTSQIDGNYTEPYYPYYDPLKHPFVPPHQIYEKRGHTSNEIYTLDKNPYYGPSKDFTIHDTTLSSGKTVNVTVADLAEVIASDDNIEELQKQLDNLNRYISGPKKLLSSEQFSQVYHKDPNAYYDPTSTDLFAKKAHLEKVIKELKTKKADDEKLKEIITETTSVETEKGHVSIENKVNQDRENTNEYIANSFYYPVPHPQQQNQSVSYRTIASNQEEAEQYNNKNPIIPKNEENKKISKRTEKLEETKETQQNVKAKGDKTEKYMRTERKDTKEEEQKVNEEKITTKILEKTTSLTTERKKQTNGKEEEKVKSKEEVNDSKKLIQ